jgi:hypothetical protein
MKTFTATFSNGRKIEKNTKRPTAYAWQVLAGVHSQYDPAGFSATYDNAAKEANTWAARYRKQGLVVHIVEVRKVDGE